MSLVIVTILSAGKKMDPTYELKLLDITKEANRIPHAQLTLLDGDASQQTFAISDESFFEPGKEIEIKLRYEDSSGKDATVFKGLVVGHGVEANDQGSVLTVELKDAAFKLALIRKSAVYKEKSDDQVIGQIIADAGLKKGKMTATKPKHPELVQYYSTDWDFALSRADVNGCWLIADEGEITLDAPKIGKSVAQFTYGLDPIFEFELEVDARDQLIAVEGVAWSIKEQKLTKPAKAKNFKLSQGNLNGKDIAKAIGIETCLLTSAVNLEKEEIQAWADAKMQKSQLAMLKGYLMVQGRADIKVGDTMKIDGIGKRFNGDTLVTGIRHQVCLQGWQTSVQFGLSADWFSKRQDVADVPAAGLLPAVNGLQIGIVDAFEEDPDKEFRVKVILPGIDEKKGAVWARLASPDAGIGRGYFFRPETGDEVVVGFFNDDPRQAVILGAMFSSKNKPPESVAKLTEKNIDKAIVTRSGTTIGFIDDEKASVFIKTPGSNKLVLDDDAETILIADQHGNEIILSKDGIEIKSAKDVKIEASGDVVIKGKDVNIEGSGNVEIKGQKVDVK